MPKQRARIELGSQCSWSRVSEGEEMKEERGAGPLRQLCGHHGRGVFPKSDEKPFSGATRVE